MLIGDSFLKTVELCKYFRIEKGTFRAKRSLVKAVDGVNLSMSKGSTHAVVGESGSGKTTLAKTVVRIYKPTSGQILIDGVDISHLKGHLLKKLQSRVSMVFQDPASSINPRKSIGDVIMDPMRVHKLYNSNIRMNRLLELMQAVRLPGDFIHKRPKDLSGGELQRVCIARALSLNPEFLVMDEPTASLDVSVQANVLVLLKELQRKLKIGYLLITHDLSVVRNFADRVTVMYLGREFEQCSVEELFEGPIHPYTLSLMSSIPVVFERELRILPKKLFLKGEIPSPIDMPKGCRFNTRCPSKIGRICEEQEPSMIEISKEHLVRCHKI